MVCIKCEKDLPENEFHFKDKTKGVRKKTCKECTKKYRKTYYLENRESAINYSLQTNKERAIRNQQFVWDYLKEHPCVECGESNPIVLQFDHIDENDKTKEISKLVTEKYGIDTIKKEIDKCQVLCANCHLKRTAIQFEWYKNIIR
jgi:hypothetical protein